MTEQFFEKPILNSPYVCPARHWELDADGQPTNRILDYRRAAKFITPVPKPKKRRPSKEDAARVQSVGRGASSALRVFNVLCERPVVTLNEVCHQTGLSFPTASNSINNLLDLGLVRELTGGRRNRIFAYDHYLAILNEGTEPL